MTHVSFSNVDFRNENAWNLILRTGMLRHADTRGLFKNKFPKWKCIHLDCDDFTAYICSYMKIQESLWNVTVAIWKWMNLNFGDFHVDMWWYKQLGFKWKCMNLNFGDVHVGTCHNKNAIKTRRWRHMVGRCLHAFLFFGPCLDLGRTPFFPPLSR